MKKLLAYVVSAILIWSPLAAQAGMATSESLVTTPVETILNNAAFTQQMSDLGIGETQLADRLSQMTDAEQAQLANNLDSLPAGQDVLSLAFTLFLIFMVTDMLGATDVFTFVNEI